MQKTLLILATIMVAMPASAGEEVVIQDCQTLPDGIEICWITEDGNGGQPPIRPGDCELIRGVKFCSV